MPFIQFEQILVTTELRVSPNGVVSGISRSDLADEAGSEFVIPWTWWRRWDAIHEHLTGTANTDDLELAGNTFATGTPAIETGDIGAVSGTRYARASIPVPMNYKAAASFLLRFSAGMNTAIADGSMTLDIGVYKYAEDGVVSGSDLYSGAAVDINNLTFADYDFVVDAATLLPGDMLDVRIAMAFVDTATPVAIGRIGAIKRVCTTNG